MKPMQTCGGILLVGTLALAGLAQGGTLFSPDILLDTGVKGGQPGAATVGSAHLVVWVTDKSGNADIHAKRITADGVVLDPAPLVICDDPSTQVNPKAAGNASGFMVVWEDGRQGTMVMYGTYVSAEGQVATPNGRQLVAGGGGDFLTIGSNGSGFLVAWRQTGDIYGVRLGEDGLPLDADPIAISTGPFAQYRPTIAANPECYLVVWEDYRYPSTSGAAIFGARLSAGGQLLNPPELVLNSNFYERSPAAAANGWDFLVLWTAGSLRFSIPLDIHGTAVNSNGVVRNVGGVTIDLHPGNQSNPRLVPEGQGYMAAWLDDAMGPVPLIAGARFDPHGVIHPDSSFVIGDAARARVGFDMSANRQGDILVASLLQQGSAQSVVANVLSHRLRIESWTRAPDSMTLRWFGRENTRYQLQRSPSLSDPQWVPFLDPVPGAGCPASLVVPISAETGAAYHRLQEIAPE